MQIYWFSNIYLFFLHNSLNKLCKILTIQYLTNQKKFRHITIERKKLRNFILKGNFQLFKDLKKLNKTHLISRKNTLKYEFIQDEIVKFRICNNTLI